MIIPLDDKFSIDLANLPKKDWERIKQDANFLIKAGHCKDVGKAYIAAFFIYLEDLAVLATPFNPDADSYN